MKNRLFIFVFFVIFLNSCLPNQSDIPETPAPIATNTIKIASTATFTLIPPTFTATTPPITKTSLPSQTSTITPVPTESIQFDQVRIFGLEDRGDYFLVILEFPNLDQVLGLKINGNNYTCVIDEKLPDKLLCSGSKLRIKEYVDVKFYSDESNLKTLLYEGSIYVPEPYKTPMPLGDPNTWCPLRGTDVYCETEHRVEFGEECWVSTCSDACGYYYSYHTCQLPPDNNFLTP